MTGEAIKRAANIMPELEFVLDTRAKIGKDNFMSFLKGHSINSNYENLDDLIRRHVDGGRGRKLNFKETQEIQATIKAIAERKEIGIHIERIHRKRDKNKLKQLQDENKVAQLQEEISF